MARHLEHLAGGLVTSRDPVVLAVGELSAMQNAVYRPGDLAVYRASGRDIFGAVNAQADGIRGLRDVKFDNGDHYLLAMQGVLLASAAVGDTGTFASATNFVATAQGTALDAVQFNNRWYLFGGGNNLVLYVSATAGSQPLKFRSHGLQPNTVQVDIATGAGTWTAGSTGFFEYWFTEVLEYVQDGVTATLESTFNTSGAIPRTVLINSTALLASITIPGAPTNTGAQKWRLYRAGPKALATEQAFPVGFRLADGTFGTTNVVVDGGTTTGSYENAAATANSGFANFANPTNVFSSNDAYATHTGTTPGAVAVTFATITVSEPIVGVEVSVEGHRNTDGNFMTAAVSVSNDGGITYGSEKVIPFPLSNSDSTHVMGSSTDLWGLGWTAGSFTSGKFVVRVRCYGTEASKTVYFDHIKARVTYAGTKQLDESQPFDSIVIEAAGVDAAVGSHGPPPPATTGDIFQGTLVTNSRTTGEQALIRYSLPSEPDYFPAPYFLDFETPDNDVVTNIKTLNNRLGVFLATRLYRVNYLPTEADADFNRGICREEVSGHYGCVNAMCATVFAGRGGRSEIAFVSNVGIHSTDLFSIRDLTSQIDWRTIISATNSTPIALINDPEHSELLFFYKNSVSGSEHYKCLHLSYDDIHTAGGGLKISGPVNMRNHSGGIFADLYSAWAVQRTSGLTSLYMGYGSDAEAANATAAGAGKVYIETGNTIPALDSKLKLRTRRMFLGGLGQEIRLDRIYTYTPTGSAAQVLTFTPYTVGTNASGVRTQTARSYTWDAHRMIMVDMPQSAEGLELEIAQASNNAGAIALQSLMLEYTNYGTQDSGS